LIQIVWKLRQPVADPSEKSAHGTAGGDVVIADLIFEDNKELLEEFELGQAKEAPQRPDYRPFHIRFFINYNQSHPHQPDIQVLLKTCVYPVLQVNILFNYQIADEWFSKWLPLQLYTEGISKGKENSSHITQH
jgi:hypothetical protein